MIRRGSPGRTSSPRVQELICSGDHDPKRLRAGESRTDFFPHKEVTPTHTWRTWRTWPPSSSFMPFGWFVDAAGGLRPRRRWIRVHVHHSRCVDWFLYSTAWLDSTLAARPNHVGPLELLTFPPLSRPPEILVMDDKDKTHRGFCHRRTGPWIRSTTNSSSSPKAPIARSATSTNPRTSKIGRNQPPGKTKATRTAREIMPQRTPCIDLSRQRASAHSR